ncbi:MAG TPA: membrane protein insertase YidC [Chthoniobacterales bacterium]|nr:membrane protein insertase YidC [Chthoniobacterales bacterium]
MDRTAWIAVILCVLGLFAWQIWTSRQAAPRPAAATTPSPAGPGISATPAASAAATVAAQPAVGSTAAPSATPLPFAERTETLRNSDVELHFTNRGGGIAQAILLNYPAEHDESVTLNSPARLPIGAIIDDPATPLLPEYTIARAGDAVTLEYATPEQVTIRKKFSFATTNEKKENFVAKLDVDFINSGAKPYGNTGYFFAVGSAAPIHANDYPSYTRLVWLTTGGGTKGIDVGWFAAGGGFLGIGQHPARPYYTQNVNSADWVAASSQFFTSLVVPLTGKADAVWGKRFDIDPAKRTYGLEGAMHLPGFRVEVGQTYTAHFQLYLGPKLYHRLARLDHNEAEVMEFGVFKIICQALLNILNSLHSVLGNYAAAILALTTIVKLSLWPLQNKATASMRRMSALSPKIQELREKYKDDPTRMNQEVMKLYKEYGINPVGGCLPMLIQIPIFFGLFTMLRQAVELRGASFLWIKDLSQPDTVGHLPILGWPINVLPLIMAATSFWMTHLTPKSGDPTQQRMMMFMPIIFIVFCYNFAAALALYYTAQNLFSILQLYQNRKQPMPTLEKLPKRARR